MKTGNKIALFYTAITIGIISVVTVVFYFVATDYISRLYYSYLTEKAYATAQKHWEKDELDEEDYARIQQHYEETLPVAAEILLNADSITEAHAVLSRYLTDEKIASLYAGNVVRFHEGKELGAAVYYPDNEGNFIVLVVSSNQYGGDIQHRIGWLLLGMLVISAVLVYFVGRLYATRMVDRIDAAYQSEKSFISNASHELNNPLTAIQGECEISLLKERTPAEYQAALGRIASETKRIILLMKNLLFLSHGDKEILKNARETVLLADFLMQFSGVNEAYSANRLLLGSWTPEIHKIRNGYHRKRSGDLVIDVLPGWTIVNENGGENKVVRHSYIPSPLIFMGHSVKPAIIQTPVTIEHIAPTLAHFMRIRAPNACTSAPITDLR